MKLRLVSNSPAGPSHGSLHRNPSLSVHLLSDHPPPDNDAEFTAVDADNEALEPRLLVVTITRFVHDA